MNGFTDSLLDGKSYHSKASLFPRVNSEIEDSNGKESSPSGSDP